MANYQKAYYHLLDQCDKAISALIKAQLRAEAICIDETEKLEERLFRLFRNDEDALHEILRDVCKDVEREGQIISDKKAE